MFLRFCAGLINPSIIVWDPPSSMSVPYREKHLRDIDMVERRVLSLEPAKALHELDEWLYDLRQKGEGYGVIDIAQAW